MNGKDAENAFHGILKQTLTQDSAAVHFSEEGYGRRPGHKQVMIRRPANVQIAAGEVNDGSSRNEAQGGSGHEGSASARSTAKRFSGAAFPNAHIHAAVGIYAAEFYI